MNSFDTIPKEIEDLNLVVLLYADEMVIFSESVDGLQNNVRYPMNTLLSGILLLMWQKLN